MEARLRQALARAEEVARELADPETARNPAKLRQLGREHARLEQIRQTNARLARLQKELVEAREVLQDKDPELAQLARIDVERLRPEVERCERQLAALLAPADPMDDRDAIVEIRAGTGGDEAALFAARGPGAYGTLRYESGVHRVQRVPVTEAQGRIHTSAATVAVLPEAQEVD